MVFVHKGEYYNQYELFPRPLPAAIRAANVMQTARTRILEKRLKRIKTNTAQPERPGKAGVGAEILRFPSSSVRIHKGMETGETAGERLRGLKQRERAG